MQAVLDEVIKMAVKLKPEDRQKLMRVLQEQDSKPKTNGGKGNIHPNSIKANIHPNTVWIKEHHAEYAGKHVALKDGELIAFGDTIKEADVKAKERGVEKYMLTYLFPLGSEPFGGW